MERLGRQRMTSLACLGAGAVAVVVYLTSPQHSALQLVAWFVPMVYMGTNYAYNAKKVSIPTQSDQEALTPKLRDFK